MSFTRKIEGLSPKNGPLLFQSAAKSYTCGGPTWIDPGIASPESSAAAPGLPTVAASGLPGYELVGKTVLFAPSKTNQAIIRRLNQEIVRALNGAEVKENFFNAGIEVVASSPEQFAATIKLDIVRWGKVIKDAGIKID